MRDEAVYGELRDQEPPPRLIRNLGRAPLIDEDTLTGYELRHRTEAQPLTDAELRVLRCYSVGMTLHMVADVLGVSSETVKTQKGSAVFALRAKNTTHAVCLAIRGGLIA